MDTEYSLAMAGDGDNPLHWSVVTVGWINCDRPAHGGLFQSPESRGDPPAAAIGIHRLRPKSRHRRAVFLRRPAAVLGEYRFSDQDGVGGFGWTERPALPLEGSAANAHLGSASRFSNHRQMRGFHLIDRLDRRAAVWALDTLRRQRLVRDGADRQG